VAPSLPWRDAQRGQPEQRLQRRVAIRVVAGIEDLLDFVVSNQEGDGARRVLSG